MPEPLPRGLRWCLWPLLPIEQRPSPCGKRVGAPRCCPLQPLLKGAPFRGCSIRLRPSGRRDVYISAEAESLPSHAWDMLITRIDPVVMGRLALPPVSLPCRMLLPRNVTNSQTCVHVPGCARMQLPVWSNTRDCVPPLGHRCRLPTLPVEPQILSIGQRDFRTGLARMRSAY